MTAAMILFTSVSLTAQQPNIVFIVVDDAGYVDFGFMGSTEIPTPNLDSLAQQGVIFTQAHTGQACSPSRAAFLTGSFHNRWGYEANLQNTDDPLTEHFEGLPNSAITMFERLKALGYSTSVAGKWHVGGLDDIIVDGEITVPGNKPPKQGVDHFVGFQAGGGLQEMFLNPDGTNNVQNISSNGQYWSDFWGDRSIAYIDQHYQDPNPFFLYISFNDPHAPIQEAPSYDDPLLDGLTGLRRRYASELLTVDYNVGRVIDKLNDPDADGNVSDSIMDNTLIVFLNDNGGVLGNSADNGDLRDQKGSPYDGGTRVPMFILGPGVDSHGTTYDKLVHSIDIVPTMVAAAGGSIAHGEVDGVNLLPFINGIDNGNPHEFIAQRIQEEVHFTQNDWKLVKNGYSGSWELYDFSDINNQSEQPDDNLAASNPAQVELMQRLLTDWEVTIDKQRFPSTDETIGEFNLFDDFLFRAGSGNFSTANRWESPNQVVETMRDRDSHAGTVFHFEPDAADYEAINDLQRMNQLEFIAHGFKFEGTASSETTASIRGLPILLANNLDGDAPFIDLATVGSPELFSVQLETDLLVYDDLVITGNSVQSYRLTGDLLEYRPGRAIAKHGNSSLSLLGQVNATGSGFVALDGKTVFFESSQLNGNLTIASAASVDLCRHVVGDVNNMGMLAIADSGCTVTSDQVELLPELGDGDVDSRNSSTAGDQDTQILVGSVSNATASQVERVQRCLFSFDLSDIPDSSTITEASILFQLDGNDASSNNNISGDLELYSLGEDPQFNESGSENVDWNRRDKANNIDWSVPGGTIQDLVAMVPNADLPNPLMVQQGDLLAMNSLPAFDQVVADSLADDAVSFALILPGEEDDAANMVGDRDLFRIGSNESTGAAPALLEIAYVTESVRTAFVTGNLVQAATGQMVFTVESGDEFSDLQITGNATVDGQLQVKFGKNYSPVDGQEFELISSTVLTGSFQDVDLDSLPEGFTGDLIYDANRVVLRIRAFLIGDVNCDGSIDLLDVGPFIEVLSGSGYSEKADINQDGNVDLLDVGLFIELLAG